MEQITKIRKYFCDACGKELGKKALVDTVRTDRMFCDEICAVAWFVKYLKPQYEVVFLIDGNYQKGRILK